MEKKNRDILTNPWKVNTYALESSKSLLKLRIWFYAICFVHLAWLAVNLLPIDLSGSKDEQLLAMGKVRQVLYTAWTNYFQLFYFPLAFYVDWKELKGQHMTPSIEKLRKFRNFFFTSIVCPSTMFAGCFFWRLWMIDRTLLVPIAFDEFIPVWMQHNLHTVTVVVCFVDLLLVPRLQPHTDKNETLALKVVCTVYTLAILLTHDVFGIWVYPLFAKLTPWRLLVFVAFFYVEHYFFYYLQWLITELVWGTKATPRYSSLNKLSSKLAVNNNE